MAIIYIAYAEEDREFSIRLKKDLEDIGHEVWLDEMDIKVGDWIPLEMQKGLKKANYLVLVLSPDAINSGWVTSEWVCKLWEEQSEGSAIVLPVLFRNCDIPELLKPRKYANFTTDYEKGFAQLQDVVGTRTSSDVMINTTNIGNTRIAELLAKVHSRDIPLTQCIIASLALAEKIDNYPLMEFCKNELKGYDRTVVIEKHKPTWRLTQAYLSCIARINFDYVGWGNSQNMWNFMQNDDSFLLLKTYITEPISIIEKDPVGDPTQGLLTKTVKYQDLYQDLFTDETIPMDTDVYIYLRGNTYEAIVESIRVELTRRLVGLLPG